MYIIDIKEALGIKNRPVYQIEKKGDLGAPKYENIDVLPNVPLLPIGEDSLKSVLGTPVLNPVLFEAGSYKTRLKDGRIITVSYDDFLLPPTTLIEAQLKKIVIKTPLVSGLGQFAEFVCFDDYDVSIRGVFSSTSTDEIEKFRKRLVELWKVPIHIEVTCDYLNLLGVTALRIENVECNLLEGRPRMQPFVISCTSDTPIQLNIGN